MTARYLIQAGDGYQTLYEGKVIVAFDHQYSPALVLDFRESIARELNYEVWGELLSRGRKRRSAT